MLQKIKSFEEKSPEIIFSWKDRETEAEGWVVINSLRGGAAGGGTRMRKGLNLHEVVSLAKTMEIKFSVAGPQIGGAKSGINFDPQDPRKAGVLNRWYAAVLPLLKSYYGTGGDLNVDEIHEVIPVTYKLGLLHPQEGIVNGHLAKDGDLKKVLVGQLTKGVSKVVSNKQFLPSKDKFFMVADLITGYGVAVAIKHQYEINNQGFAGKRALVQGFGNVGGPAAWYLTQMGIKVVGILDRDWALVNEEGFSEAFLGQLLIQKNGKEIFESKGVAFEEAQKQFWNTKAEIFTPNAGSRMVSADSVDTLIQNGLEVISPGANVPFEETEIFLGPIALKTDNTISLIPDFIANCGMARVFAYLMKQDANFEDNSIFEDVSNCIKEALLDIYAQNKTGKGLTQTAYEIALNKLSV